MMVKSFSSLGQFAEHLNKASIGQAIALQQGLKKAALRIQREARAEIGEYQPDVGPFPAWAPLAESTEQEKERLGYKLDAPLLREGDLRDSYMVAVSGLEAIIGSKLENAVWQELGTPHIPPRPVLGPAAVRSEKYVVRVIGEALLAGILQTQVDASQRGIAGYEPRSLE